MATVNFYLDKPNRKEQRPILLTYLLKGQKIRFSTRLKTIDKDWNPIKQRIKKNASGESEINFTLDEFERIVTKSQLDLKFDPSKLTLDYIKNKLEDSTGNNKGVLSFFEAFEEYIEEASTTKTIGSKRIYQVTLNKLKVFNKVKGVNVCFENMDSKFEIKFKDYLMIDCQLVNNTVGKYFKTLKAFLNFASERGYTENRKFKTFKVFKEDADIICLSESELMKVYNFENFNNRLELVKDAFCLGCFTGLRYSDLLQINEENIKNDFIELKSQKTRDFLKIPLNKYSREILNKYNGQIPKMITNQKMNEYLKEIGEIAEINESIQLTKYRGTERIQTTEPKFKFMSTHTARRTFVTLSLERGMRPELVMSITGHKDYKTFKKYIKLTENVRLAEMNNIWK
jgi:site-specific recombinase XerD